MRTTSRARRGAAIVATAAGLALVAGCSGAQPGGSAEGDATAWPITGGVHEQLWTYSFDAWNEQNPDSPIDDEFFANDAFKERIRTSIGAGTDPTLIFNWAGGALQDYVDGGNVVDITEGTSDLIDRVLPSVAQAGIIDGKVYAVPNAQSQPVMLYYNQELFDEVGVEPPTSWSELLEVVQEFNDAGIAPFSVAGQSRWPYLMWIQYLTDRIGGPEVFQAVLDGEADAWSDPAILQALAYIQDLVEAGGFVDGYGSVSADANADLALVYTGRAAMLLQGSWVYSTFTADAADWVGDGNLGTTVFPAVEGGAGDPANIVGNPSNYWAVSANATEEQKETVTRYLNELVFDEDYTTFLIEGGGVPPIAGIEDQLAAQDDADFLTLAYGMVRDAPHFQLSWDQALPPAAAQELLTNLEQIFLLQSSPEQFVTAMNATLAVE
ncbi:extracellular solute-binding protein [Microbacterium sp. 18062]|uniref:extracellular solute-binding protein n=1 Tax=Microbacterium sp. 18062 TaxID=2681410 RepID=UPI00135B9596|nr:extracellular solute-binding protein [Microbacterium sp. 18062]